MRMILHDFGDDDCLEILSHLRAAAQPSTQLVVVDNIMAYSCPDHAREEIVGDTTLSAPEPLLRNFGAANITAYLMDVEVYDVTLYDWHEE